MCVVGGVEGKVSLVVLTWEAGRGMGWVSGVAWAYRGVGGGGGGGGGEGLVASGLTIS